MSRSPPSPGQEAGGSLGAVGVVPLDRSTEDLSCIQRKGVCVCRGGGAEKVIGRCYQELNTIFFFCGMRASCLLVCLRQPFITICTVSNPTLF